MEGKSKFEIILPDGSIYRRTKKESSVQGYDPDGKPKKMRFEIKSFCERCGQCCIKDTPVLLKEDLPLLINGIISERDIYTVREGEATRSLIDGDIYFSSMELIKIRPIIGTSTCLFYDYDEGCTIYENRPTVCKEYECWNENVSITGLEKRRLTRLDVFGSIDILKKAIEKHEENCSLNIFNDTIDKLKSKKSETIKKEEETTEKADEDFEKIVEMILYDSEIRQWAKDKLNIQEDVFPLIFGKRLLELAPLYGLIIQKEGQHFIIKVMEVEE